MGAALPDPCPAGGGIGIGQIHRIARTAVSYPCLVAERRSMAGVSPTSNITPCRSWLVRVNIGSSASFIRRPFCLFSKAVGGQDRVGFARSCSWASSPTSNTPLFCAVCRTTPALYRAVRQRAVSVILGTTLFWSIRYSPVLAPMPPASLARVAEMPEGS